MVTVATDKAIAVKTSKKTAFFLHTGISGAPAHIDDKYGIDVDDMINISDILSEGYKNKYSISITLSADLKKDMIQLGYLPLDKIKEN